MQAQGIRIYVTESVRSLLHFFDGVCHGIVLEGCLAHQEYGTLVLIDSGTLVPGHVGFFSEVFLNGLRRFSDGLFVFPCPDATLVGVSCFGQFRQGLFPPRCNGASRYDNKREYCGASARR